MPTTYYLLPYYMQYLGIDWGEKRIGLALGDDQTRLASPFKVVSSIDEIIKIIAEEEIDCIVIGKPVTLKNEEGGNVERVAAFIKFLKEKTAIPIEIIDERLTSRAADNLPGDKKSKAERDAVAAMIILQTYFDTLI